MTLGSKRRQLTRMIGQLIEFAYANGYELTFGDAYREPRVHGAVGEKKSYSSAVSLHKERRAVDFNLFKGGKYMTASEDYRELGEFWESIGGAWGGRFNDGNHFSLEHWAGNDAPDRYRLPAARPSRLRRLARFLLLRETCRRPCGLSCRDGHPHGPEQVRVECYE